MTTIDVDYQLTHPTALHAKFQIQGFTALLGRSGAGKTSLLKALAGLIPATGTPWPKTPPERRPIGYVPQNLALFPHLTVIQNAAFALTGPNRMATAHKILTDLNISHLASRPAPTISGGEAQRTALARALAANPQLLLLDEPTAALDTTTRNETLTHLIDTIARTKIPALAATHDPHIAALATQIALLHNGAIIQQGPTAEIFSHPISIPAAKLLGYQNFWQHAGQTLTIRPEHIEIAATGRRATITSSRPHGPGLRLTCTAPEPLVILLPNNDEKIAPGQIINLRFPENRLITIGF